MFSKLTHSVRSRLQAFLQVPTEDEVNSAAEAEIQRSINEDELCGDLYEKTEDFEERLSILEDYEPFDAQAYTESLTEALVEADIVTPQQAKEICDHHASL